ncbi:MAG: hypothetical protein U1E13_04990, partial [Methylophilaceae bacterium]|nr:hypothetical protein [Methylophilaceae bacterium]
EANMLGGKLGGYLDAVTPGSLAFKNSYSSFQAGSYGNSALWALQGGLEIGAAAVTGGASQFESRAVSSVAHVAKSTGKIHGHHSDPKFLGGDPKQPLTQMNEANHRALHKDMNDFLRTKTDEFGNHMRPQRGNSGRDIQQNFTREQCVGALCEFYQGPGAKYEDAARDFFKQH